MKTKILIVEDDPHILLGLEEVLKSEDYEVVSCHRGDQAQDAVVKHRPGLVVLDVRGPKGYSLMAPPSVMRPIWLRTAPSVNHNAPSAPTVSASG